MFIDIDDYVDSGYLWDAAMICGIVLLAVCVFVCIGYYLGVVHILVPQTDLDGVLDLSELKKILEAKRNKPKCTEHEH